MPDPVPDSNSTPPLVSRTDRRARTKRRHGTLVVIAGIAALTLAVGGVLLLVRGSGDGATTKAAPSPTRPHGTTVDLKLGDVSADHAGPPVTVTAEQSRAVLDLFSAYVQDVTVNPLRSGAPATADLGAVFDAATLATATTVDRGVLFDENLPKVTGSLVVAASPISVLGLGDQGGRLALVTASTVFDVTGQTAAKTPLHIQRKVDFTIAPDATGAWKVTAYDVVVTRAGGGVTGPTTSTQATR